MPNQGVPVIFKNKIAYGYAEKSVQAYDVSVSDYNALTEQQQLDGSIRFIQGVDAIPNGSNVWAKLGTTPLAEGLPRDCSQAVNELKSNLTELSSEIIVISCKTPTAANSEQTIYSDTTLYNNYVLMGYSVNVGTSNIIWGYNNVVKEIMITNNVGIRMTVTVSAAANCDMFVFLHKKS